MIDTNPAPGRFIFSEPYGYDALVGRLTKVSRIAGQRIVCKDEGKDKETFLYKWSFVCDTQAEVDEILRINAQMQMQIADARNSANRALMGLMKETNK